MKGICHFNHNSVSQRPLKAWKYSYPCEKKVSSGVQCPSCDLLIHIFYFFERVFLSFPHAYVLYVILYGRRRLAGCTGEIVHMLASNSLFCALSKNSKMLLYEKSRFNCFLKFWKGYFLLCLVFLLFSKQTFFLLFFSFIFYLFQICSTLWEKPAFQSATSWVMLTQIFWFHYKDGAQAVLYVRKQSIKNSP